MSVTLGRRIRSRSWKRPCKASLTPGDNCSNSAACVSSVVALAPARAGVECKRDRVSVWMSYGWGVRWG